MTISVVRESAVIHAPMARLFALSTSIDLVRKTLGMTPMDTGVERGLTSGHVVGESRVVWRGWKFGLPTQHHTLITGFTPPQKYVGRAESFYPMGTANRGGHADHYAGLYRGTVYAAGSRNRDRIWRGEPDPARQAVLVCGAGQL